MRDFKHGTLEANGIIIHYVEHGDGPLVVMCHGFPESWYSWRYQLPELATKGYRVVALDMRGYGGTSTPQAVSAYSLSHVVGDVVGAIGALGETKAVVVGHDWGAPVAWYSALMRPDVVKAVACLSVPARPPFALPEGLTLSQLMAASGGDRQYYRTYFQRPDVAETELEANVRDTLLRLMYSVAGDVIADGAARQCFDGYFPKDQTVLASLPLPERLPPWLSEADLDMYVGELSRTGFRGGLNWYRNIDAIPGILSPFIGATIRSPALYLYGEHDLIAGNTDEAIATMKASLPDLRDVVKMDGAGHWLQQERADEVNRELVAFLNTL